jgi:hypothetical protein
VKLYRKMLADVDGKPLTGDDRDMLGVRPKNPAQPRQGADVKATSGAEKVYPGEGLSAFTDPGRIPPQVQGEMWVIETDDLPPELAHHQRGKKLWHYQVEPAREMTLDELQALLADTRDLWSRVDGGANP